MANLAELSKILPPGFIDPPPLDAPRKSWQRFLSDMQKWPQDNLAVQRSVALAKGVLKGEIKPPKRQPLSSATGPEYRLEGLLSQGGGQKTNP